MKSVSVVTNARIQSTRIPQKMIRPFAGTTLLDIALEKLNRMDFFENRFLGVAEEELAARAARYPNVSVLRRKPESVAPGVHSQIKTFAHYLDVPSDFVFVFNPCLPFVSVDTIRKAFDYFQATDHPSYTACVPTRDWIFDAGGNSLTNKDPRFASTMAGAVFYKGAHAFHIINRERFRKKEYHWSYTPNDPHLVEIPKTEHVDIDDPLDFEFAEFLYRRKKRIPNTKRMEHEHPKP